MTMMRKRSPTTLPTTTATILSEFLNPFLIASLSCRFSSGDRSDVMLIVELTITLPRLKLISMTFRNLLPIVWVQIALNCRSTVPRSLLYAAVFLSLSSSVYSSFVSLNGSGLNVLTDGAVEVGFSVVEVVEVEETVEVEDGVEVEEVVMVVEVLLVGTMKMGVVGFVGNVVDAFDDGFGGDDDDDDAMVVDVEEAGSDNDVMVD